MRLIDADALMQSLGITDPDCPKCKWYDKSSRRCSRGGDFEDACCAIDDAPTIEPELNWIKCSERLPEEDDYKSCIECLDGAVWYFTENGTMGIGYYYKSTKEWSTTDDLKTDGKVIAWMPLPECYREGEG